MGVLCPGGVCSAGLGLAMSCPLPLPKITVTYLLLVLVLVLGWGWRGSGGEITSDQPPAARSTVSIASLDTHPASSVQVLLGL